jgi:poly-D-alanine transfer protein DltD
MANGILRVEDYLETLFFVVRQWGALQVGVRRSPSAGDWDDLIAQAASQAGEQNDRDQKPNGVPMNGRYCDRFGVDRKTRDLYYKRLSALARNYDIPLIDFEEHDEDEDFLADHHDHLSDKGWLYFDKALDGFFHDRLASNPPMR